MRRRDGGRTATGRTLLALATAAALAVTAACSGGPAADRADAAPAPTSGIPSTPGPEGEAPTQSAPPTAPPPTEIEPAPATGQAVVERTYPLEGVEDPWGLAVLPDGDVLVGSRTTGTIHRVATDSGELTEVGTVPGVVASGEGGLLGLAVDGGFVYAFHTASGFSRVGRYPYDFQNEPGQQLGAFSGLETRIPKGPTGNGGHLRFGPDGALYVGTGDAGDPDLAQQGASLAAKVLRVAPGEQTEVHAAVRGEASGVAHDALGRTWIVDTALDEATIGWLDDGAFRELARPGVGAGGLAYIDSVLWMPALSGGAVVRVPLDGTSLVAEPQVFVLGEGPMRSIEPSGGGQAWVLSTGGSSAALLKVSLG